MNRCIVCGKEYDLCGTCTSSQNNNSWRYLTDTAEHYQIYTILNGYNNGIFTKKEAKRLLVKLKDIINNGLLEDVKKAIDDIVC